MNSHAPPPPPLPPKHNPAHTWMLRDVTFAPGNTRIATCLDCTAIWFNGMVYEQTGEMVPYTIVAAWLATKKQPSRD